MAERSKFPRVFWVANLIELLERYAYYGIYFGFGIYLASLGYSRDQLGIIQSLFLFFSYLIPIVSGAFVSVDGHPVDTAASFLRGRVAGHDGPASRLPSTAGRCGRLR